MSSNQDFFEAPQAAAMYKHKLLQSYIPAWAGKVGSTSADGRVVVYDAYSGPGRYKNREPGSPEILVNTGVAMEKLRKVYTVFSEKKRDYCSELRTLLEERGVNSETYEIREGPVESHLDEVIGQTGELPLFMFLDPFGLTVSVDQMNHALTARDRAGAPKATQPKTELLMNFSYEAVRRISGALRSEKEYVAKGGQIASLDRALGGEWWQPLARDEEEGWVDKVLQGYATRVAQSSSYGYVTARVSDSVTAEPVYELILFTRHPDGLWKMIDAMSRARKAWHDWLADKNADSHDGQAEFRGLHFDDDEGAWVAEIESNIRSLLQTKPKFVIGEELGEVFGDALGLARETHIRKAVRNLHSQGISQSCPKGSLQWALVKRA